MNDSTESREAAAMNTTTAMALYNPRFTFGPAYLCDCAEQRMLNVSRSMEKQLEETMKEVRRANAVIEAARTRLRRRR